MIKESNSEIKTIVDIGANIGCASVYFKSQLPGSTCYAIEAAHLNFTQLEHSCLLNKNLNIIPKHLALWYQNQLVQLGTHFRDGREWSISIDSSKSDGDVQALTLAQIMNDDQLDTIDLLKIDIEGAEFDIIKNDTSIENTLSRVKFLTLEIHNPDHRNMITQLLEKVGFQSFFENDSFFAVNSNFLKR